MKNLEGADVGVIGMYDESMATELPRCADLCFLTSIVLTLDFLLEHTSYPEPVSIASKTPPLERRPAREFRSTYVEQRVAKHKYLCRGMSIDPQFVLEC